MHNRHLNIILPFLLSVLAGCGRTDRLESALAQAGKNRIELEKVLDHYAEDPADSLKYRAACFLIENMPFHYSFADTAMLRRYNDEVDSVMTAAKDLEYSIRDSIYTSVTRKHYAGEYLERTSDIRLVSADYLIDNIELAFRVWGKDTWSEHLDFGQFCEYILPYKFMEGQELDDWRKICHDKFCERLDNLRHCPVLANNPYSACNTVSENAKEKISIGIKGEAHMPVTRTSTMLKVPWGTCEDYAYLTLSVMNAKGIPCAIDFTPQWPFRSMGHTWNVLLERSGRTSMFEGIGTPVGTPHKKDHKMAKVFRMTYSANEELRKLLNSEPSAPDVFLNPCMKDVTDEYMRTESIALTLKHRIPNEYAYLAVFDNAGWQPVCWGSVERKKAIFENIGRDVVYLPVISTVKGLEAVHDPVLLDIRGSLHTLTADTTNLRTLKLYRKHPALPNTYGQSIRMKNAMIQASDNADFINADTIHVYDDVTRELFISPEKARKYRYWRYFSCPYAFVNVAELAFFERDSSNAAKGKIIGTEGSYRPGNRYAKEAVFDGDLLTFFDAPDGIGGWVGMDFGKPVDIGRITCIMRGDGNEIERGNEYELFYWQDGGWKSLGRQTASDIRLVYDNCPSNALFLLHNRTKGREERIFTYEDDTQVWW